MRKKLRAGVSIVASLALVSSLLALPTSAYASSNISNDVDDSTNWEAPSYYIDNTVEVDGTLYKVITTWANAWALSGPDYVGVSNSGALNQSGGGQGSTDLTESATTTMLGIWASSVNEVPNAYNWNFFYNMALDDAGEDVDEEQVTVINVANSSQPGYDSQSGVWACFKYRPEIIWSSNSLSESSAATAVAEINSLSYYTSGSSLGSHTTTDEDGNTVEAEADASGTDNEYYIDGDEDYDPYIMSADRTNSLTKLESIYELAGYAEAVVEETADYNSDGAVTSENVTWKTMNSLPRTTRYEASTENAVSATECALDLEKLLRGSVYYTLSQIEAGEVEQKTVAWVVGSIDTTGSTATVVDLTDSVEAGTGTLAGKAGVAALTVDSLTTDTEASSSSSGGGMGGGSSSSTGQYTATADELLEADIIWAANGSTSVADIQTWLTDNVTDETLASKIDSIEILTDLPALMNGHNHTTEKSICDVYDISFFYPELWPDLELVTYWYDNIYHITKDSLNICMTYGLGNSTMPSGTELTDLGGSSYDSADIDAKAAAGYEYYVSTMANDETYTSISYLAPSDTYAEWVESYYDISDADVTLDADEYTYTGSEITPTVTVVAANGTTLTEGTDYTVAYADNTEVGTATVTITGAGSYTGTVAATFTIVEATTEDEEDGTDTGDEEEATTTITFSDIDDSEYWADAVYAMNELGILTGYTSSYVYDDDGNITAEFGDTDTITRGQVATILWRLACPDEYAAYDNDATNETTFADVSDNTYYTAAVNWAVEQGIVTGYSATKFAPTQSITLQELCIMIARYITGETDVTAADADATLAQFNDSAKVSSWAAEAVAYCVDAGIIKGTNAGNLSPKGSISRGRTAQVFYQAIEAGAITVS